MCLSASLYSYLPGVWLQVEGSAEEVTLEAEDDVGVELEAEDDVGLELETTLEDDAVDEAGTFSEGTDSLVLSGKDSSVPDVIPEEPSDSGVSFTLDEVSVSSLSLYPNKPWISYQV